MTPTHSLLTITHATKTYNGIPALIDASLELHPGEVHGLMGENGAGKSTLIKLLAGVTPADSMQVTVRGTPAQLHSPRAAFDLGLRFIHQELNVVPGLSVAENIFLGQRYPTYGGLFVRWGQLNREAQAVLSHLGIQHIAPDELMARLSPGDRMLVKITAAFAGGEAAVYVMDEPTAALTGEEAAMLFRVIDELKARGCAVLYVSHRLDEIARIADRVTVLRDGRVIETRQVSETTAADLIRLMTGRDLQQFYPPRSEPANSNSLLSVRQLFTSAIQDISFELAEGEILGVAGLNGSGRTELLRALMGADRITSGEIWLANRNLTFHSPANAWQQGIAFVPEERRSQGLILSRSVGNNITLPHLQRFSRARVWLHHGAERSASQRLGDSVRLKARGHTQIVRELSGGNQQKVIFARTLAHPPRLLLLDEPTRGVDVGAKYDLYSLIRQISSEGTGILMVSSELSELIGICDRILIMRQGRLTGIVPAAGQTETSLLALCYG